MVPSEQTEVGGAMGGAPLEVGVAVGGALLEVGGAMEGVPLEVGMALLVVGRVPLQQSL